MEKNIILDADEIGNSLPRRRALLPVWIKIFTWFFIVTGGISILMLIAGIFGIKGSISLYGLNAFGSYSVVGMTLTLLFLFKGIVGYGLWTEKDWAVKSAVIDAIVGIVFCVLFMFGLGDFLAGENDGMFNFRFEILVLIPFLMKMLTINKEWADRRKLEG